MHFFICGFRDVTMLSYDKIDIAVLLRSLPQNTKLDAKSQERWLWQENILFSLPCLFLSYDRIDFIRFISEHQIWCKVKTKEHIVFFSCLFLSDDKIDFIEFYCGRCSEYQIWCKITKIVIRDHCFLLWLQSDLNVRKWSKIPVVKYVIFFLKGII